MGSLLKMQFINDHFSFDNLKRNISYLIKQILNGSGNIGVFILLSIITVATSEGLGLSNREINLEHRLIQNMDLSIDSLDKGFYQNSKVNVKSDLKTLKKDNNDVLSQRLRIDSQKDYENRNIERTKILFEGAIEQYLYENKEIFPNSQNVEINDKIKRFNNYLIKRSNKKSEDGFFDI